MYIYCKDIKKDKSLSVFNEDIVKETKKTE